MRSRSTVFFILLFAAGLALPATQASPKKRFFKIDPAASQAGIWYGPEPAGKEKLKGAARVVDGKLQPSPPVEEAAPITLPQQTAPTLKPAVPQTSPADMSDPFAAAASMSSAGAPSKAAPAPKQKPTPKPASTPKPAVKPLQAQQAVAKPLPPAKPSGKELKGVATDALRAPLSIGANKDQASLQGGAQTADLQLDAQNVSLDVPVASQQAVKETLYKAFVQMNCIEFNELTANYESAERNYHLCSTKRGATKGESLVKVGKTVHKVRMTLPGFHGASVSLFTDDKRLIAIDPATYDTWLWQPPSTSNNHKASWKKLTHQRK